MFSFFSSNSLFNNRLYFFVLAMVCLCFSAAMGDLTVTPEEPFISTGPQGGPFEPSQIEYTLTNVGDSALFWGTDTFANWLESDIEWGSLDPNESIQVNVTINEQADSLSYGQYNEDIIFTDITAGVEYLRPVSLTIEEVILEPVAWWKMDGDATDSSGNGYDGLLYNTPEWVNGIDGQAVQLDPNDYVEIEGYNGIFGTNARTVSAWIKTEKTAFQTVLQWGQDEEGKLWLLSIDKQGNIALSVYGGGVFSTKKVTDNQWHHVAAVLEQGEMDSNNIKLYVDGDSSLTESYEFACEVNTDITDVPVHVGAWYKHSTDSYARLFEGLIDDVRIYDFSLSQQQIRDVIGQRLIVTPDEPFDISGEPSGPFSPAYKDYTIKNVGNETLYWGIEELPDWIEAESYFGMLNPNESTSVRIFLTEEADLLEEGVYTAAITINNLSVPQTPIVRDVNLDIQYVRGIWAAPDSFDLTLIEGMQHQEALTIGNDGTETLNFSLRSRSVTQSLPSTQNAGMNTAYAAQASREYFASGQALIPEHKPGQLLVRFNAEAGVEYATKGKQSDLLAIPPSNILRQFRMVPGLSVVQIPDNMTMEQALVLFNNTEGVVYAQPNYRVYANSVFPNDARFDDLWGLHNIGQTGGLIDADIDAPEAWDVARGSDSVIVAVIDTGVDYTHEDLAPNMWVNEAEFNGTPGVDDDQNGYVDDIHGYDFVSYDPDPMDDHYHGTHCAGTIGAVGNNGIGVTGVCWNVKIMAIKFLDSGGGGWTDDAIASVEYATLMGANLTSNSWGGGSYNQSLKDAIEQAGQRDILFVAAAGNDSVNNDTYPHYPSSYDCDNLISVMATDRDDDRSSFSNYGMVSVDLGAPGSSILSCEPGNRYQYLNGTSMAAPHVSGACALLWSVNPGLSAADVKAALLGSVDPTLPGKCVSEGRLNINNAILQTKVPWIHFDIEAGQLLPDGSVEVQVTFDTTALEPGQYHAEILVLSDDPARPTLTIPVDLTVLPDPLEVTPDMSFDPNGFEGGPFTPVSMTYTLENIGVDPLDWSIDWQVDWLGVDPNQGTLDPNQTIEVTVQLNSSVDTFAAGLYEDMLIFNNLTLGSFKQRPVNFIVRPADKFTEQFGNDFDLPYHSILLRPEADCQSYYLSCVESDTIAHLPVDPNEATCLSLADDDFTEVLLADGKQIQFYGHTYDRIFVGSNGYLTFGQGDTEYEATLDNHFMIPRIAPLYTDLSPINDEGISYLQTDDRIVITYHQVPVYGDKDKTNTFQVELFFADGAIRMSYLDIQANDIIVGLSQGLTLPNYFEESDLSSYLKCCDCGDLDGDSQIGIVDLSQLALAWLQIDCQGPDWCGRIDFDHNGQVDFTDFAMFSENWQNVEYAWSEPNFLLELNGKAWSEPVHLYELDDNQGNNAKWACLSHDRLTMYFTRYIPSMNMYAIVEATRPAPHGPFTSERILTELNTVVTDIGCTSPWITSDNLRLYYREEVSETENRIKMAQRTAVGDIWTPVKTFDELHENGYRGAIMSLTEDELTIVWHSGNRPGTGYIDLWMATRPSTDDPFENIRELAEINTIHNDTSPCIMPDGLTLYFDSQSRPGGDEETTGIYKTTRSSLTEPFGNLELIEIPNYETSWEGSCYVTPDEKILYYQPTSSTGKIYMTTFQPAPTGTLHAWSASVTEDNKTIYFTRYIPELDRDCILEASRSDVGEPFGNEKLLTELITTDFIRGGAWISSDGLRLYYHEHDGTIATVKMAHRTSVDDAWTITCIHDELNGDDRSIHPALSADELIIVYGSARGGSMFTSHNLWIASRESIEDPFGNIRPLDEVNTEYSDYSPYLSADGLTLYYSSKENDTDFEIYKAERFSLDEPFGNVQKMPIGVGLDTYGVHVMDNERKIYFNDRNSTQHGLWHISVEPVIEPCLPK